MRNEIFGMKQGIKTRLESIPGLRVVTYEPEDWSDFPVAVIKTDGRNGSLFEADFVVTVMAGGSNRRESYDTLDSHIATSGKMSIEAAIDDDVTLGGAADRAYLVGVDNIRIVRMGARRYVGADFRIRVESRTKAEATPSKEERSDTLSNEREGTNRNYFDMTNIPGARGALAQIKINDPSDTWSGAQRMWIAKRSVKGRDDNLSSRRRADPWYGAARYSRKERRYGRAARRRRRRRAARSARGWIGRRPGHTRPARSSRCADTSASG